VDPHRRTELRSIALHGAVVKRLREEPALIEQARKRIERWTASGALAPRYARAWLRALDQPLEDLSARLVADDEDARAMRQCSPFAGALSARERWRIWREGGEGEVEPSAASHRRPSDAQGGESS
jgi:hypothetical protein